MSEHSCSGPNRVIRFSKDGIPEWQFIRLCDGHYWGGSIGTGDMTVTLDWILRKIAEFANDFTPGVFYEIEGHGWRSVIGKRMDADRLAGPLACGQDEIRRFFALSIEIPNPDAITIEP